MKDKLLDSRLPRKRPRSYIKEDDSKRKPVTTEELEKIKKFDAFIEKIISKIDPFTVNTFEISSSQLSEKPSDSLANQECMDLFAEYITEPQKQKKSKSHSEFSECKKRFDLILNREDPEQDLLLSSRFEVYNESLPVPESTAEIVSFLESLPAATKANERKQLFQQALELSKEEAGKKQARVSEKLVQAKILEFDPPPAGSISLQEKLVLLRAMAKHLGDWEKIGKEFKDKPVPVDLLKKIWRCLKVTMKEEVTDIKKKAPSYHYIKWLRAAVRKLEQNNGKKAKNKGFSSINLKPKEQRIDMLTIMAEAENTKCIGIESSTSLNITSASSFKLYGNVGTLQELCN